MSTSISISVRKFHKWFLLFAAFTFPVLQGFSQYQSTPVKKSDNLVTVSGKNYYLHEVLKGQTLYGIAKAYEVDEAVITEANSIIKAKGLTTGLVIRIPSGEAPKSLQLKEEEFIYHTVQPKETLSSLSRQYGIRIDDIRTVNPDTKWGLTIGQKVKIPKSKISIAQTAPANQPAKVEKEQKAPAGETNQVENSASPCRNKPSAHTREVFNLTILLPLNLPENDTLIYSDTLAEEHFRFYEFLEGAYLAIDSLRQEGLNMNLTVIDTERNPETIKGIIQSGKLNDADLIIGPAFRSELELVVPFARKNEVPLVNPFSPQDFTTGNPNVFQVRVKPERQEGQAIRYIASQYRNNVVVIVRWAEKGSPETVRFMEDLRTEMSRQDPNAKAQPKIVYFTETGRGFLTGEQAATNLDHYLSRNLPNFIVIPSNDEVYTTELINKLNLRATAFPLITFGLYPEAYKSIDLDNLFNVNFEVYSDFEENPYVDFQDPEIGKFCTQYRLNWNIDPSRYSFQGFDLTYYFTKALFYFGRDLTGSVACWDTYLTHKTLQTPLRFQPAKNGNGHENQAIPIIRYSREDLVLKRVN